MKRELKVTESAVDGGVDISNATFESHEERIESTFVALIQEVIFPTRIS